MSEVIVLGSDESSDGEDFQVFNVTSVASRVKSKSSRKRKPSNLENPGRHSHKKISLLRSAMREIQNSPLPAPMNDPGEDSDDFQVETISFKKKPSKKNPRNKPGPRKEPAPPPPCNVEDDDFAQEPHLVPDSDEDDEKVEEKVEAPPQRKADKLSVEAHFVGKPISASQAKRRWPHRYNQSDESPRCSAHYEEAVVDGEHYKLGDYVSVNGEESDYLGKALEFFKSTENENWFRIQWFYRFSDTAIKELENVSMDARRIFYSDSEDDNFLECITGKIKVACISPADNFFKRTKLKPGYDFYFDMGYRQDFSTFYKLPSEFENCSDKSTVCNESSPEQASIQSGLKYGTGARSDKTLKTKGEFALLDLYSGCGGMSTGLCMGAALGGVNIVTKWALDLNEYACESMKYNHPDTEVRNEDAESFLHLLREWQKLCEIYEARAPEPSSKSDKRKASSDEYEVEKIVGIRVTEVDKGSKRVSTSSKMPDKPPKRDLQFKVHWKGYTDDCDSWEPLEHLEECQEKIREFIVEGRKRRLLPYPGEVDIICGGPPCQGASGFNRFRNKTAPLECPRNRQMMIYMDIVEFLRPKFVLMENVVDILKFCGGILGRYAMFRLVNMHYQTKLGLLVAGSFGLPQFRMRVFLWGAAPSEALPAFPLPTHEVVYRGVVPQDYLRNTVKYEDEAPELEPALVLKDAIYDLPPVENYEKRNDMPYRQEPKSDFQRHIRSAKHVFYSRDAEYESNKVLHDQRPLQLNEDDYQRICRIPKKKGANFRDLGGLKIREDNSVELDLSVKREHLPSGKPLVPDYAISFIKGRSLKPFARLWWDETVPTVVTRAEPHNQKILHPLQDRVLTIRENARLQGFPDWYKLFGPVKERYTQVGNAVAVPVARALGYSLALANKRAHEEPLLQLPKGFPCF